MGHKVHPKSFRLGQIYTWNSRWFSRKNFSKFLQQDVLMKEFIKEKYKDAGIDRVEIERSVNTVTITIYIARPGIIIGRGGVGVEELKKEIKKKFLDPKIDLNLNVQEISSPSLSASIILQNMISDIEKRVSYRRVMRQVIKREERTRAEGIKVKLAGRLDGAEIARKETLSSGKIPLHTIRADIDYAQGVAQTIYGSVGVKVWIYKGEVFTIAQNKK